MKIIEEIKQSPYLRDINLSLDGGTGVIHVGGWDGSIIWSNGAGWEHVSVSPFIKRITPSWEDMCKIKNIFFNDDEAVIQVHPSKTDYVNNMPNCLHLWRCTYKEMVLPPSILVGIRKDQSPADFRKEIKEAYEIAGEKYLE